MGISKYETFLKVVELGSLTQAAQTLGCTQSGVSHIISSLEEELGFPLLHRSRSGVTLTADGERVLPVIRSIRNGDEQLLQISASIKGLNEGTVRIGTFSSVAVHWLPGILKKFESDYPNIRFRLLSGDYYDVEQWLSDGSIDVGFVTMPLSLTCECIPLMDDRILAVLPKEHRLAEKSVIPLAELENEPFISLLESSAHDMRRALEGTGLRPRVKFNTKDDYAILAMVENGLGISIMPELILDGREQALCIRELENKPRRKIALAFAPGAQNAPATLKFSEYVEAWVRERYR